MAMRSGWGVALGLSRRMGESSLVGGGVVVDAYGQHLEVVLGLDPGGRAAHAPASAPAPAHAEAPDLLQRPGDLIDPFAGVLLVRECHQVAIPLRLQLVQG